MKKILITGGAGFIGRHLVQRLSDKGYSVTVIDNEYRWKRDLLDKHCHGREFKYIKGDVTDEDLISKLIQANDIIIHLAGITQVMTSIESPEKTFLYKSYGTYLVSKYCSCFNKRLIFASSREVYGNADYLPVDLKHKLNPENPYAASKISAENFITNYGEHFGLNYLIFRLSNVYGHGDRERVIPIFLEKALKGEDLILFGNNKVIDFIYIDDVVDAFLKSIDNNVDKEIVNLGSGVSTTLKELAELVLEITNSDSKIIISPERRGEVDVFTADISRTKEVLEDWQIKTNLKDGLKIMID